MNLFLSLYRTARHLLLFFTVLVYLFFEELIWAKIVVPIHRYIQGLRIHELFLRYIEFHANRYIVLFMFMMPFVLGEVLGIASGILVAKMHIISAFLIYMLKVPLALLAFSILKAGKQKLDSFVWFAKTYNITAEIISKLKGSAIYLLIRAKLVLLKEKFKLVGRKILNSLKSSKI